MSLLLTTLYSCGVSESEHNKVKSERDYLALVVTELEKELYESKNKETIIIDLIESSLQTNNFTDAKNHIESLLSKYPESPKKQHYSNLLPEIDKKIKDSIRLADIKNLGIWEVRYFVDEFGDPTENGYITNSKPISGTFSNWISYNSDLYVDFIIESEKYVAIQLFEGSMRSGPERSNSTYQVRVQDCNKEWHTLAASIYDSDRLSFNKSDSEKMFDILLKGGEIKFSMIGKRAFDNETKYNFRISNADWLENAYLKLTHK